MEQGTIDQKQLPGSRKENWSIALLWLNLVLSILIVFLHIDLGSSSPAYVSVKRAINVLADCAVPAFFCVSAYLSFRREKASGYQKYLQKKSITILLPYLLWNGLACAYQGVLALLKEEEFTFSLVDLLLSRHNAALWFLRVLFGYVILTPIIIVIAKNKILSAVVVGSITVCNLFIYTFPYDSLTYRFPCYLLGACCGVNFKNYIESDKLHEGIAAKCVTGLLLGIAVVCGVFVYDERWYYAYRILGGVIIILLFLLQSWNRVPASLLQNSFFTFCSHTFLLGFAKVFARILPNNGICLVLGYVFCAAVCWFATVAVAEVLKKFLPKLYAVLVGRRKNMRI